jgi:hypothetical protein
LVLVCGHAFSRLSEIYFVAKPLEIKPEFSVLVKCADEPEQRNLLAELDRHGLDSRALPIRRSPRCDCAMRTARWRFHWPEHARARLRQCWTAWF